MRQIMLSFMSAATLWVATYSLGLAQELRVTTVTRPPFSQMDGDLHVGFSVDLMNAIAAELGRTVRYDRVDGFGDMLSAVETGKADAAIANISITAGREALFDFSQPMFDSGIQVMLHGNRGQNFSVLSAILTREFALWAGAALAVLFGGGILMWFFERGRQSWFDRPASEALFPSFWWALNLMLNGGFEERMPNSRMGRVFAVFLVISSLFFVSIFVAQITAALTVEAINETVDDLNDLNGRRIGTIDGSTSAMFLDQRNMSFRGFAGLDPLLKAFESKDLDAVIFDGPILAYYAANSEDPVQVLDRVYRPENYGIALPARSSLREPINQALLRLREEGVYQELLLKWFGTIYDRY